MHASRVISRQQQATLVAQLDCGGLRSGELPARCDVGLDQLRIVRAALHRRLQCLGDAAHAHRRVVFVSRSNQPAECLPIGDAARRDAKKLGDLSLRIVVFITLM
jgi:hypothetical protein